jgi:type I restriction enzyme S subunit
MAAVSEITGSIIQEEERKLSEVVKGFTAFRDGDVLVAKITPCFENGKIALAKITHELGFGSTEFHVVRAQSDYLDTRYLFHFLRQPRIRLEGERRMTGSAGQRRVPKSFIENLEIPLPSLAEQRRIAAILDAADALREKRRQIIAKYDTLLRAVFLEMFGDPVRNPKGWDVFPLSVLTDEFRYGTSNRSETIGKPTLRIPNVVNQEINLADLKYVPVTNEEFERLRLVDGDLLFVRTNGNPNYVGRCAVFDGNAIRDVGYPAEDFIFASYLIRARLNRRKVEPKFLQQFLNTSEGRKSLRDRCQTSAGQYNINTESLGAIQVPVPPLSLQDKFTDIVKRVEALKTKCRRILEREDSLFHSLQHRAFTGKLLTEKASAAHHDFSAD